MTRTRASLASSLVVAASLALAGGLAQAQQTFDVPQVAGEVSTMTNGAPNVSTDNDNAPSSVYLYSVPSVPYTTAVMGAGPAVVYSYGYTPYPYPLYSPSPVHGGASETSNVPLRAGEASTMTHGAPNVETQN